MSVTRGQYDASHMVTFPAARHHRPLAGTKLYRLLIKAHVSNLSRVAIDNASVEIETRDLLVASPTIKRQNTQITQNNYAKSSRSYTAQQTH